MLLALVLCTPLHAAPVRNSRDLRAALATAKPGDTIVLARGVYQGGLFLKGPRGTADKPVTLRGEDREDPPVIQGGKECLHLSDPAHLVLEDLIFEGAQDNGINIDDGGSFDTPAHHVTLRRVTVRNITSQGNHDAIKLSGVTDFVLEDCRITGWGSGGSAIDMVGCHRGLIVGAFIWQNKGRPAATGIQMKGGSSEVTVRASRFSHAGARAISLGGSTGKGYFRPPLSPEPGSNAEAKNLTVEGCTFVGSEAPLAFVGVDGAVVRHNTFVNPGQWLMRILQESRGPQFVPSRGGEFTRNLIVYRTAELQATVNIGPNTAPDTFEFAENYWFAADDPPRSVPKLPTPERDPAGGADPQWNDPERPSKGVKPGSPAAAYGSHSFITSAPTPEPAK